MKSLFKDKKLIICIAATLIILLIIGSILLFNNRKKGNEANISKDVTNNYVAYVKINPLIKLEFSQTCKNTNKNDSVNTNCENPIVTRYELVNDDAKTIYKDINLIDVSDQLWSVLTLINTTAKEHNIVVDTVDIYSGWDKLDKYINDENNTTYNWKYNINIKPTDELKNIINSLEGYTKTYTVSFDSNGGSKIGKQEINENEKINEPSSPTRNGYKFVEWQLDGKKYDFNTEVNKDITLIAKWTKNNDKELNSTTEKDKTSNTVNNDTKTKEISIQDIAMKNMNNQYRYAATKKNTIKVTLTGNVGSIDKINESNIELYVDVKDLKAGTHNVKVMLSGIGSDIKYTLNPTNIDIVVSYTVPAEENVSYFDIPWEIINDGTYEQFAKKHGITINLVADDKYKCSSHFSRPSNPNGYKKGDVVIAYGFMGIECVENCVCSGEECQTHPPRYETKFLFGACGDTGY